MEVVNTTSTIDPVNMYNYLNNYILNPTVFIIIILIIFINVDLMVLDKLDLEDNEVLVELDREINQALIHNLYLENLLKMFEQACATLDNRYLLLNVH